MILGPYSMDIAFYIFTMSTGWDEGRSEPTWRGLPYQGLTRSESWPPDPHEASRISVEYGGQHSKLQVLSPTGPRVAT